VESGPRMPLPVDNPIGRLPMPIRLVWLGVVLAVLGTFAFLAPSAVPVPPSLAGTVVGVVDGGGLRVDVGGRIEHVRYIGLQAPALDPPVRGSDGGGREALEANRGLVADRPVHLEFDAQPRDRLGRLLAYVWVEDVMINAELLRLGYARAVPSQPNTRYEQMLIEREREAREAGRGFWRPL
jgi:micrococcal nuclease